MRVLLINSVKFYIPVSNYPNFIFYHRFSPRAFPRRFQQWCSPIIRKPASGSLLAKFPTKRILGLFKDRISIKACPGLDETGETLVNRERAAEINLHSVARDSAASEPIHAGIVIKLRFSVTGAPAVTKLRVMPRVTQRSTRPPPRKPPRREVFRGNRLTYGR